MKPDNHTFDSGFWFNEEDEADFFKNFCSLDTEGVEGREFLLRHLLTEAGYKVKSIGKAPTHPVLIIHLIRTDQVVFVNNSDLKKHLRSFLIDAGYHVRTGEITVSESRGRILLAFQTGPAADVDAILREPVSEF